MKRTETTVLEMNGHEFEELRRIIGYAREALSKQSGEKWHLSSERLDFWVDSLNRL